MPLGDTYIVANFKETQLGRLRLGQTVEIEADAFPGQDLTGRIDSFAPATGSEFALIPVENATGNFTKITQRVPVRILVDRADGGAALRPGLSVEVKVDLKSDGGATLRRGRHGPDAPRRRRADRVAANDRRHAAATWRRGPGRARRASRRSTGPS